MLQNISRLILKTLGWQIEANVPDLKKFIIVGAPHTSNWDFPLTLLLLSATGLRFSWIAKHSMFIWPFGVFFRSIGGIPVDRKGRSNFVNAMVGFFQRRETFIIAIAPEGTRAKTDHWKAGFLRIAIKAQIPICLGYIDYTKKTMGIGKSISLVKNIEEDFNIIKHFYQDISGKYPKNKSEIRLRPKEIAYLEKELTKISGK